MLTRLLGSKWLRNPRLVQAIGLLGIAAAIVVATRRGPGINHDSSNYLSAALNLEAGSGLKNYAGDEMTVFAPLLPVGIAFGIKLGLSAETAVRLLNVLATLATVLLGFRLLRRHVRPEFLTGWTVALVASLLPLLQMGEWAWTEPAFIAVSLAFVTSLEELCTAHKPARFIVLAALLSWLAFGFRYAGLVFVPIGAIAIFFGLMRGSIRLRVATASAYSVLAAVGPVGWMIRNKAVDGTLLGHRTANGDGVVVTVRRALTVMGDWVMPAPTPQVVQLLLGVGVVLLASWAIAPHIGNLRVTAGPEPTMTPPGLVPIGCFAALYVLYIVATELITAIDPLNGRLMSPAYVPMLIVIFVGLDRAAARQHVRQGAAHLAGAVVIAVLVFHVGALAREVRSSAIGGQGYTSRSWQSSQLIDPISSLPAGATIISNRPDGVWALTHREPVSSSLFLGADDQARQNLVALAARQNAFLVWFNDSRSDVMTMEDLGRVVRFTLVHETVNGSIYRLLP